MAHWLYPANTKLYDVVGAFEAGRTWWPANSSVAAGDAVFIYLAAPHKQIAFACDVPAVGLAEADILDHVRPFFRSAPKPGGKPKTFMELSVTARIHLDPQSPLGLEALRAHGLGGMLMGPRKLENNPPLLAYIREAMP